METNKFNELNDLINKINELNTNIDCENVEMYKSDINTYAQTIVDLTN